MTEGSDMASYAPAGGVLLVIGGFAAIVTFDVVLIVIVVTLAGLAFGAGVALYRAGYVTEGQGT